jgi:hypothetical protein
MVVMVLTVMMAGGIVGSVACQRGATAAERHYRSHRDSCRDSLPHVLPPCRTS